MKIPLVLLITEDTQLSQHLIESFKDQVTTLVADDGNTGIAMAEVKIPDVILIDLVLPKRSGFLVLEYMRCKTSVDCPIVFVGRTGSRNQQYAELLGVSRYFCQPYEISKIAEAMLELIAPKLRAVKAVLKGSIPDVAQLPSGTTGAQSNSLE